MKYTSNYIRHRAAKLNKGQIAYLLRNLRFLPKEVQIWTSHVPYVLKDEYSMSVYPYDRGDYGSTEGVIDYLTSILDDRFAGCDLRLSDLQIQYYRATALRSWGNDIPLNAVPYTEKWHYSNNYGHCHTEFMNRRTAIGMETMTESVGNYIHHAILPLALISDSALELYACSPLHEDGYPKYNDVVGKGFSTVRDLWCEIGGEWLENSESHIFPWSVTFFTLTMPNDVHKALFDFVAEICARAVKEWPEEYAEWISECVDLQESDDDLDDDDEDEDEEEYEADEEEESEEEEGIEEESDNDNTEEH